MPNRPSIPAEIVREILCESGHRCAVCGAGCPLERAHIIPWRNSREHKAEDLICLCANCHQRADLEKWGAKTLRRYKDMPWVLRHRGPVGKAKLKLEIETEVEHFDEKGQKRLRAIVEFLESSMKAIIQGGVFPQT